MKIKSIKWDRLLIAAGLLQGIDVIMGWFSVSFRIVSAIIALIALFFLVIYFLRRKKVILLHDEISRYIIDEINSIREQCKANNGGSELTDSWLPKYSQLLESLSDVFRTSILDRMLNSNLMELIEKSVVWTPEDGNDGCSESLKSAFDDLICIFAGNKTLSIVRSWKVSGRCKSAPDRGIDADIDPRIIDKIAERMIERFRLWIALTNNKGKIISVLLIGANNQKLTQLVLEGMRDTPECEGLNLFIRGTANDNEEFIKNLFGKDDSGDNRDKVRIQTTEIEFYDVAIVTHYYQHHDFNHYLFVKMPVVEGGLLLWLSAISRARDFDEYVCEGCMPKRANILNNYMRGGIPFASMKQFGKKQYIFYTPFREFASNSGSISPRRERCCCGK